MPNIPLVDLNAQHANIQEELDSAVKRVMAEGQFINGPDVKAFEEELAAYLGVEEVVACGNGTDALQLALMALNLPKEGEVIVPDFSFVATAEAVQILGLNPVLVDIDPDTFNMDPEMVKKAITPNTCAIMPAHLFGQCAPVNKLKEIAEENKIYLIEDVAQALGAEAETSKGWQKAGTIGDLGCTSFFPVKNLGCMGDGGAVFTNDPDLAYEIRCLRQHGMSGNYTYKTTGMNSRLDTLQAAILRVKLPYLDYYNQARQEVANYYDQALKGNELIQLPSRNPHSTHVFQQYTIKIQPDKRDHFRSYLNEAGIPSKVFYPSAIHEHKAYREAIFSSIKPKQSMNISREVLSLPMYPELSKANMEHIALSIQNFEKSALNLKS